MTPLPPSARTVPSRASTAQPRPPSPCPNEEIDPQAGHPSRNRTARRTTALRVSSSDQRPAGLFRARDQRRPCTPRSQPSMVPQMKRVGVVGIIGAALVAAVVFNAGFVHVVRGRKVHRWSGIQICTKLEWTFRNTFMNTDDYVGQP